jgi:hypothetical protein
MILMTDAGDGDSDDEYPVCMGACIFTSTYLASRNALFLLSYTALTLHGCPRCVVDPWCPAEMLQ